jgi:hypothetical protein
MAKTYASGGRRKKKADPLKTLLKEHSLAYFTPDDSGTSPFDRDCLELAPNERAQIEVKILEYHTAKNRAVDATMAFDTPLTIEDRLAELCGEPTLHDGDDDRDDCDGADDESEE